MSISAIKAGKAFYEILAEDKTDKGLSSAEAKLRKFGMTVGAMGLAIGGFADAALVGLGAMVKAFAGAGDEISDAMNVTGLSGDFLQTLRFGAADAGVSLQGLIGGLTKFNSVLAKAAAKGGQVVGIDAKDLMAMKPDERILAVVDAIEKIPDPAQRARAAMDAFGKSGAKLLPAFEGGAEALTDAMADLKSKGLIMSDEDRQLAVQAEGAFLSMGLAIDRVTQVIAAAATPAFLAVFDVIQTVIEGVVQFIDKNRALVAGLTIGLGVLAAVGTALFAVGVAATVASFASAGLAAIWAGMGVALAVITSPITLIVAAIVACGAAALVAAYQLDQLFNAGAGFQALKDMAATATTGIQLLWTAISNGKWDLAGQLVMNGLGMAFEGGLLALKQMWVEFANWFSELMIKVMQDVVSTISEGFSVALENIEKFMGSSQVTAFLRILNRGWQAAAPAAASEMRTFTKQSNRFVMGDTPTRFAGAAGDLARTIAELEALNASKDKDLEDKAGLADFGNVSKQMEQSKLIASSAGFSSSVGAGRIGFAAPPNAAEEKQVELLGQINKGIDDLGDKVEGLEGLAFE